jgi:prepilin peptidase CpaA
VDGLLFSLAGFGLAFVLFLALWILGVCGGGDVKLFAALGAWIGPELVILVLLVSAVMLVGYLVLLFVSGLLAGKSPLSQIRPQPQARRRGAPVRPKAAPRLIRYSLVVALATAPVLLWAFRVDLRLADPRPVPTEVHSNAR